MIGEKLPKNARQLKKMWKMLFMHWARYGLIWQCHWKAQELLDLETIERLGNSASREMVSEYCGHAG